MMCTRCMSSPSLLRSTDSSNNPSCFHLTANPPAACSLNGTVLVHRSIMKGTGGRRDMADHSLIVLQSCMPTSMEHKLWGKKKKLQPKFNFSSFEIAPNFLWLPHSPICFSAIIPFLKKINKGEERELVEEQLNVLQRRGTGELQRHFKN